MSYPELSTGKLFVIGLLLFLFLSLIIFRYEIIGEGANYQKYDRWTGKMWRCEYGNPCFDLEEYGK